MSYSTMKQRYHVRPGLKAILDEAGITGVAFFEAAGISKATFQAVCKGAPFVRNEVRQKVIDGIVARCGRTYRARVEALWDKVPNAEVRINGDKQVQVRLRHLAAKHGLTAFEYLAALMEGPRDPLEVLESCFTGRKRR